MKETYSREIDRILDGSMVHALNETNDKSEENGIRTFFTEQINDAYSGAEENEEYVHETPLYEFIFDYFESLINVYELDRRLWQNLATE